MKAISFDLRELKEPLLFVGLGNIGKDYELTRHNAGFLFVDRLALAVVEAGYEPRFKQEKTYDLTSFPELKLNILKPRTLMNLSGKALHDYYRYHDHLSLKNLVVAHDDLDLLLGDYKINNSRGPRLHNGLRSIEQELGSQEFTRIRIGIENRMGLPISGLDYVLMRFRPEEITIINDCLQKLIRERFTV